MALIHDIYTAAYGEQPMKAESMARIERVKAAEEERVEAAKPKNIMMDLADKLKSAKESKKALEAQIKELNAEISKLDLALTDAMAESECERFSHNGSTFYLNSRLYASPASGKKEDLIAALRKEGYGSLVTETVNSNTLSSFVKEQKEIHEDTLPQWLSDVVTTFEKISVGIRKS